MDAIRRFIRPELRRPRAIVAFEGWNDACDAASGAVAYILGQRESAPYAVIEPEEFFDFQSRRPIVSIDAGGTRSLEWPVTRCFGVELPDDAHDLVVVLGEEPQLRWKTYARLLTQLLSEADVELVVTLGAFIGQVPHTLPVPLIGVATDPRLVAGHGLLTSRYEGPTGITGVMMEACREAGIPTIGLWAATPHYLAANPNPKAMRALLEKAAEIIRVDIDTAELDEVVAEFDERVERAMGASTDLSDYVRRLEEGSEDDEDADVDLNVATGELISDIEQYLRDQR